MLSLDDRGRRKLIWIGALIAPTLAVQLVRLASDGGPAAAPAAVPGGPESSEGQAPAAKTRPLTTTQREAIAYLASHALPESIKSPMDSPDPQPVATTQAEPVIQTPATAPAETGGPEPVPALRVHAIVGTRSEALASINHRLHRVGDEVAPGWRITAIDPRDRVVRLTHSDGRTAVFSPATP